MNTNWEIYLANILGKKKHTIFVVVVVAVVEMFPNPRRLKKREGCGCGGQNREREKSGFSSVEILKKCTWINYEKEKFPLNEEKLIGIKTGFVPICKIQGGDFSVEQKRGIWDCLAA